jgi:hypothetical protein
MSDAMTDENVGAPDVRAKATRKLPSTRLGFPKQLEVLRAFALLSAGGASPVHYGKVAQTVRAHDSNVSTMNPFFVENGLLLRQGNQHLPAQEVLEFARKHSWNKDSAATALGPIVGKTWFADAIMARLHFKPLSENEAVEILAAACSAGPEAKPQLRMLIDYMEASSLLRRENGQLIAIVPQHVPPPAIQPPAEPPPSAPPAPQGGGTAMASTPTGLSAGRVAFHVNVDVDMAELSSWSADRIAAFFKGVAEVIAAQNKTPGPTG